MSNKILKTFEEHSINENLDSSSDIFEEEAKKAAREYAEKVDRNFFGMKLPERYSSTMKDFLAGAEWAKKNN